MDAVIFDMDGVLIDSEPIYMHHVLEFYRRFDIHVPYKEVVKLAGSSHEAGLEMMSAWWKEDITPSEFEKFYEANSDEEIVYSEILNPYVLYVLKRFKARGMKLAIASSSPKQAIVTMVNECGLKGYFNEIISGHDFPYSKPDPSIYLYTPVSYTHLTYCGLRNGYGYRDTVQDIQGVIHLAPEMAADKIRFMLSAQVDNGGGLPLVKFTHNPGHEDTPDDASYVQETGHPAYRADDALWLFPTVYKYVSETGNVDFIDEVIPFANKDEGTVYEHLKRAIQFSMEHLGKHGMPAGLYADWNDCLRLGKDGESTFVALQFYYAMTILKEFAAYEKDEEYISYLEKSQEKLGELIEKLCWNEDRFIRGFTEAGEIIGQRTDPEANMWLNPQSWAVISGLATKEQSELALEQVYERLNTEYGAILMDPPYHAHAFDGALAVIYNAGTKENAGIFSQSQGWIILAEALMGHGERAFGYFMENAPAAQNDKAEIRRLEPYCYGQFTEGKASPNFGRSHVHWLTGTASTVMVGCVEGILGMRPDFYGLRIAPSIPKEWDGFEVEKDFRGCHLHIKVQNPGHAESGFKKLTVNGEELKDNYIPQDKLTAETEVELYLS